MFIMSVSNMVTYQYVLWFGVVVLLYSVTAISDLPLNFPRCKRTDPKLEECLLAATEQVRPDLIRGVPDFLPSIVNFTVPRISMEQGNRAVNFKASFENTTLMGLENYKFTQYRFNVANLSFNIDVRLPSIYLSGQYALEGNILVAPIKGHGNFYVNLTDASCSIFHTIKIENRHGIDFIKPLKTFPKMNIGHVVDFGFTGLFKDNKQLEKVTKNVVQNNLDVIIEEVTPTIEKVLGKMFDDIIFRSVTRIPYDKLYPE